MKVSFYGQALPKITEKEYPGKLIVMEGPDGVGRSTQIALLREYLEASGYAVSSTGLKRSELAAQGIEEAKKGHTMDPITMGLFYAADFADRLEREIIPALRAGFVVLTDRYIYSLIARAEVRGVNPQWIREIYGFALVPSAIMYLRCDLDHLVPRVLNARGFDYWESGMDYMGYSDFYQSYLAYQQRMLSKFAALGKEFGFIDIDANGSIEEVFSQLRQAVEACVSDLRPTVS
ncbi:MAG: thymidylate kinase [Chloroflexi bacterium]|nr:thymidylate kinase [Chloroflexota bacterium]